MEFVDGAPLAEYATSRDLDTKARLQLFLLLCGAVQFAHQNLVIHRDIKPANVLVTTDGDSEAAGLRHRQAAERGPHGPDAGGGHPARPSADDAGVREP